MTIAITETRCFILLLLVDGIFPSRTAIKEARRHRSSIDRKSPCTGNRRLAPITDKAKQISSEGQHSIVRAMKQAEAISARMRRERGPSEARIEVLDKR
jgi:hypothetical protein